jgi:Rps23 Pro-64 3,4-dihydroxylase Tpa1-like proline 4-hydroxylase
MTPKQILDSFSETLMQDERILSAQERALLANLLHHARTATTENQETQEAVRSVIASAVGETVAQRAFAVLGGSIVERILRTSPLNDSADGRTAEIYGAKTTKAPGGPMRTPLVPGGLPDPESPGVKAPPKPPHGPMRDTPAPLPDPESPGVKAPTKPPHGPMRDTPAPLPDPESPGVKAPTKPPHGPMRDTPAPLPDPESPGVRAPRKPQGPMRDTPDPESPGHDFDRTSVVAQTSVAVAERPPVLKADCIVLDEFLAPQEVEELVRFTLAHEGDFKTSEVVSPYEEHGIVNYEHRRSRVLMDLEQHEGVMLERIKSVLPQVLRKLGMEPFTITGVETQVTASNDGDFFHFHSDNTSERVASRYLTFVYFFHREPRQFEGGELRIHDARLEDGVYVSDGHYQTIIPRQNQIVFFPCQLLHEITPVKCSSQLFADSRFTLNGWLRR